MRDFDARGGMAARAEGGVPGARSAEHAARRTSSCALADHIASASISAYDAALASLPESARSLAPGAGRAQTVLASVVALDARLDPPPRRLPRRGHKIPPRGRHRRGRRARRARSRLPRRGARAPRTQAFPLRADQSRRRRRRRDDASASASETPTPTPNPDAPPTPHPRPGACWSRAKVDGGFATIVRFICTRRPRRAVTRR